MSGSGVGAALVALAAAFDGLAGSDLTGLDRGELLAVMRDFEAVKRRLPVIDHRMVGELDARGTALELGCRDTAVVLREVLRLAPGEARARVSAARDLGPRRTLTGEPLPPLFAHVAVAQADGTMSAAHARLIIETVAGLPAEVEREHGAAAERFLVGQAQQLDPARLAVVARRLADTLDPDGVLADDVDHARRRTAMVTARRDGSGEVHARSTPACLAVLQAVFDPLAAPRPSDADGPDRRSPGQRLHDALEDAGRRLLAVGELPSAGGVPATVIVTMTLEQLESRVGRATTVHGGLISVGEALRIADEAQVIPVVLADAGGVLAYGRTRRIASAGQRLALLARDGGCSFPGCDIPASWAQVHHTTDWALGGSTDLNQLCLLCGHHHREFARRGWRVDIYDGIPWWTPPPWIDPDQQPQRNHVPAILP